MFSAFYGHARSHRRSTAVCTGPGPERGGEPERQLAHQPLRPVQRELVVQHLAVPEAVQEARLLLLRDFRQQDERKRAPISRGCS